MPLSAFGTADQRFTVPAAALPATRSVLTIVAGNIVYDKLVAASPASGRSSARTE